MSQRHVRTSIQTPIETLPIDDFELPSENRRMMAGVVQDRWLGLNWIAATASGWVLAVGLLSGAPATVAQSAAPPQVSVADARLPVYDVVSIKPNKSASGSWSIDSNEYRYSAKNISLRSMLEQAYGVRSDLISGIDGPVAAARFDIEAKIVEPDPVLMKSLTPAQYRGMVVQMLREHFGLVVHNESKIAPVYDLELAKDGPKFKKSANPDAKNRGTSIHNREMEANSITMAEMATTLTNQVQRTVVDKTGLTARYDLKLKWSAEDSALDDGVKDAPPVIFTALKEQLGLKLQPGKGPVETLVVDHVELPSEN